MIELVTTFSVVPVLVPAARVLRGDGFLAADFFRGTAFLRGDGFLAADFLRGVAFLRRAAFFFAAMSPSESRIRGAV